MHIRKCINMCIRIHTYIHSHLHTYSTGRPYSMRDALIAKLGVFTNAYLSSMDKSKNAADKARLKWKSAAVGVRSPASKGAKKKQAASDEDDDDGDGDDDVNDGADEE